MQSFKLGRNSIRTYQFLVKYLVNNKNNRKSYQKDYRIVEIHQLSYSLNRLFIARLATVLDDRLGAVSETLRNPPTLYL